MIIGPTILITRTGYTVKSMSPNPRLVPFGAPMIGYRKNFEALWLYNPLGQKIQSGQFVKDFQLENV